MHIPCSCESRGNVLHNDQSNRPLAASHSPPCWRAKFAMEQADKQRQVPFKNFICHFICLVPVRRLSSSMTVLYHVNGQQQRAYSIPQTRFRLLFVFPLEAYISKPFQRQWKFRTALRFKYLII